MKAKSRAKIKSSAHAQQSGKQIYTQAVAKFNSQKYAKASKLCISILNKLPDHVDAINLLGVIAQKENRHGVAVAHFRRAMQIACGNPMLSCNLAISLQALGEGEEAVRVLRSVLAREPDNHQAAGLLAEIINSNPGSRSSQELLAAANNALQSAIAHHQAGRLEAAILHYKESLGLQPDNAIALSNLGLALQNHGELAAAVECLQKAVFIKPDFASAYSNLGCALTAQGDLEAAVLQLHKAIAIEPDFADAHNNLARCLKAQGKLAAAVIHLEKAIEIKADFAEAHSSLGDALTIQGKLPEAIIHLEQAVAIKPAFAEAYSNLGNALTAQGKYEQAVAMLQQAITIKPDLGVAHLNLGVVRNKQNNFAAAIEHLQKALAINPDFAEAHNNLGSLYREQGKLDLAIAHLQKAIAIKPGYADAYSNLGNVLKEQNRMDAAIDCYQKAIAINPNFAEAQNNFGNVLTNHCKLDAAIACYRQAIASKPDFTDAHSNLLFALNYHPDLTAEEIYAQYRLWNDQYVLPRKYPDLEFANVPKPDKPLRIGYLSPDFCYHACHFFIEPLITAHDLTRFELFAYANVSQPDKVTERFKDMFSHWRDIFGVSDVEVAARIVADGIDILVDLAGHTRDNRLQVFARKPAPIQVSWIGYGYTTGLSSMDYFFADPIFVPEGMGHLFSENIYRLPHTHFLYQASAGMPEVGPLPAKKNGFITFGYFSRSVRINHKVIKVWAEILNQVPNSRLLLNHGNYMDPLFASSLKEQFAADGIEADRLSLIAQSPPWATYNTIDIALDPFPHNAGTTTFEALLMGVPVITLVGRVPVGRFGASILGNIAADDWIAHSHEDYVATAVALSATLEYLTEVRANLRERMQLSALGDKVAFAEAVERAYRTMRQRWCAS